MLRSWFPFFAATLFLAASPLAPVSVAHAGPAYTSGDVVDALTKMKFGKERSICLVGETCDKPKVFDLLVTFEFDSEKLTPAARENLNQFAKALLDPRIKGTKLEVDGHTDATGAEDYNFGLSERRAKAVVEYLASLGVDPTVLAAHGFGKTQPRVADPYSPENRRVETHIVN